MRDQFHKLQRQVEIFKILNYLGCLGFHGASAPILSTLSVNQICTDLLNEMSTI